MFDHYSPDALRYVWDEVLTANKFVKYAFPKINFKEDKSMTKAEIIAEKEKICKDHVCNNCPFNEGGLCLELTANLNSAEGRILRFREEVKKAEEDRKRMANCFLETLTSEIRDLEYRNRRDVDAIYVHPETLSLLKARNLAMTCALHEEPYYTFRGKRLIMDSLLSRNEYRVAFKGKNYE